MELLLNEAVSKRSHLINNNNIKKADRKRRKRSWKS
jgi:hypothetical protein